MYPDETKKITKYNTKPTFMLLSYDSIKIELQQQLLGIPVVIFQAWGSSWGLISAIVNIYWV